MTEIQNVLRKGLESDLLAYLPTEKSTSECNEFDMGKNCCGTDSKLVYYHLATLQISLTGLKLVHNKFGTSLNKLRAGLEPVSVGL